MSKEIIMFGDTEVEKHTFHQHKSPISIYDVNVDKIVASNRVPFGKKDFKYFIGYDDGRKVKPLFIMYPKMSSYWRDFDETKYMYFLIKNDELPEKYNEIRNKVSKVTKKRFDSEPVYNNKYLKTKIKSYEGKIITNFYDEQVLNKFAHQ